MVSSTPLSFISFLTQVHYTWTLKRAKSLSIPSMSIQVPTYFLLAASLAVPFGSIPGISIIGDCFVAFSLWLNYLVSGCLEGVLLGLSIYLVYLERNRSGRISPEEKNGHQNNAGDETADLVAEERTPLLLSNTRQR